MSHFGPSSRPSLFNYWFIYTQDSHGEGACSALPVLPTSTTLPIAQYSSMMKLSCVVVLVSSLLLATLAAAGASSSSPPSSLGKHSSLVLGRKGRELGQSSGYHYQHQSKHMQMLQPEEVAMEVKKPEEAPARWTADKGEDAEAGLIYSADYSSVAMHAGSPPTAKPKHRHPEP